MDRITDMYMIQKESLIKEMAERDDEMIRRGAVVIDEETGKVEINHKSTQEVTNEDTIIIKQVMNTDNKTINSDTTNSIAASANGNDVHMSSSKATSKKSRKTNTPVDPNNNRKKKKTTNENHNVNDTDKKSYSNVLITKYPISDVNDTPPTIRIQFQFRLDTLIGTTFGEQIRPLLHDIMMCTKIIDPNTQITPWRD